MRIDRLHLVSGKGGVGKTTVATALAMACAKRGQRTLLCEMNGGDRVAQALGVEPIGYGLKEVFDHLWVVDINAADSLKEYVLLTIRIEAIYRAVFESRLVASFLRLLPALGELTMLGKIWYHAQLKVRGRRQFDAIVVDMPATGHAQALLEAPLSVAGSIPPGPMRENALRIDKMLKHKDTTRLHVVTLAEDMPATEARELCLFAQENRVALGHMVINRRLEPLQVKDLERLAALKEDVRFVGAYRSLMRRQETWAQSERIVKSLPPMPTLSINELVDTETPLSRLDAICERFMSERMDVA